MYIVDTAIKDQLEFASLFVLLQEMYHFCRKRMILLLI